MSTSQGRSRIFVSYSHADRDWLERVHVHLRPLTRSGLVDLWDDSRLQPGARWQDEIDRQIRAAKVAIFLVSADFLASDFVHARELPPLLRAAESDGARLLSVILSPCSFQDSPLSGYQTINPPSRALIKLPRWEQEEVLTALAAFIKLNLEGADAHDGGGGGPAAPARAEWGASAEALLFAGQFERVVREMSVVLRRAPDNADALLMRARANAFLSRKEEAVLLDTARAFILAQEPADTAALLRYAQALQQFGYSRLAADYAGSILDGEPSHLGARTLRLRANVRCGRHLDAVADADWLLRVDPADGQAWYLRGLACLRLKDFEEAVRCTTIALRYIPEYWVVYDCRASAYSSLGRADEALADLSALLERAPWENDARRFKAAILTDLKRYPAALSEITLAMMFDPGDALLLCMRAETLFNLGDHAGAKADAEAVLKRNPSDDVALRILEDLKKLGHR